MFQIGRICVFVVVWPPTEIDMEKEWKKEREQFSCMFWPNNDKNASWRMRRCCCWWSIGPTVLPAPSHKNCRRALNNDIETLKWRQEKKKEMKNKKNWSFVRQANGEKQKQSPKGVDKKINQIWPPLKRWRRLPLLLLLLEQRICYQHRRRPRSI